MDILLRIKNISIVDVGAFGVMMFAADNIPFALTLERTYPDGTGGQIIKIPRKIPLMCVRSTYFKGGYPTYEIQVPGHDRILFHKANEETELDGCCAVGSEFGIGPHGKPGLLHCGNGGGFDIFMSKVKQHENFTAQFE
jgi:hypothetical protein